APPVRCGIELDQKSGERSRHRTLARSQFMQFRVVEQKVALPHGALNFDYRVAHHAAEASLGFWAVHDLLDRRVHQTAIEHGWIVATPAPLRWLCPDDVLHIF